MPSHSAWLHADEAICMVQEGENFRLQFGRGSAYDVLSINRQHAEVLLANLHRLFGLSPVAVDAGSAIQAAYDKINTLGGAETGDAFNGGYVCANRDALDVLVELGATEPKFSPALRPITQGPGGWSRWNMGAKPQLSGAA